MRPVMNECATRMLRAALLMFCASPFCASPQTAARESCCEWCWTKPRALPEAVPYGAVDGARAADLFGEVEDDSLGRRRDAAQTFDETNFDDSVLDMERVVVQYCPLCPLTQPLPVAWTSGPCDLWPRSSQPKEVHGVFRAGTRRRSLRVRGFVRPPTGRAAK